MSIINNLINNLEWPTNCVFLSEALSNALIENCWQFINSNLNHAKINNCKAIFAIFTPYRLHPHVASIDLAKKEFLIINPRALLTSSSAVSHANSLILEIGKLCHINEPFNRIPDVPHCTANSLHVTNAYLYAYILSMLMKTDLTKIDFNLIIRNINAIPYIPEKPVILTNMQKKADYSLHERKLRIAKILTENSNSSPEDLINIIYINIDKPIIKPRKPYLGSKPPLSQTDSFLVRYKYQTNKKTTVRKILSNNTIAKAPNSDDIINHFKRSIPDLTDWSKCPFIKIASDPCPRFTAISRDEVLRSLKRSSKSAPGDDGITYKDLRFFDPECRLLTKLYNSIRKTTDIPLSWKKFKTILIPKPGKNDYSDTNNWRPIALLTTLYKIFVGVIFKRIVYWVNSNNLLHPNQKATSEIEGCAQHAFTLTGILEHRLATSSDVSIGFLDIADAFGSIPHEYLFGILERIGLHNSFLSIIRKLYSDTFSVYHCNGIITPPLKINVGVKQGCPLSMLLFSLAIDPVLRAVSIPIQGYSIDNLKVSVLAYADDIALIAYSSDSLKRLIESANSIANWMGIKFRANKCATISIPDFNYKYAIDGALIPKISVGESYRYLGVPIGQRNDQTPYDTLDQLLKDFEKINNSHLYPWQKLDCYKTFLHPRMIFAFRTREVSTRALRFKSKYDQVNDIGIAIDNRLRVIFKKILCLPKNAPIEYLYGPTSVGFAGITSLENEKDIQNIISAYNMLSADCNVVSTIAIKCLLIASRTRYKDPTLDLENSLKFLNGAEFNSNSGATKTLYTQTRASIQRLKKQLNISISFVYIEDEFGIFINIPNKPTIRLGELYKKSLCTILRSAVACQYFIKLCTNTYYGLDGELLINSTHTNKLIFNGKLSTQAWRFIHTARLGLLPVRSRPWIKVEAEKKCRHCVLVETQSHVLQRCRYNLDLIKERHDRCLALLTGEIKSDKIILIIDEICPFIKSNNHERVDALIINTNKKTINMIDMKCVGDSLSHFKDIDVGNIQKYNSLKLEISQVKADYKVVLGTLIVGALGYVNPEYYKIIRGLGIGNIKSLIQKMAISNIETSARIWIQHNTNKVYIHQNSDQFKTKRGTFCQNKQLLVELQKGTI